MCVYIQYNRYDCYFIWTAIISNYFLFPKFPFWLFLEKSFFLFLSRLMCMQLQCNKTRIKVACATLDKRASGATEKCHPEKKTKKQKNEQANQPAPFISTAQILLAPHVRPRSPSPHHGRLRIEYDYPQKKRNLFFSFLFHLFRSLRYILPARRNKKVDELWPTEEETERKKKQKQKTKINTNK